LFANSVLITAESSFFLLFIKAPVFLLIKKLPKRFSIQILLIGSFINVVKEV